VPKLGNEFAVRVFLIIVALYIILNIFPIIWIMILSFKPLEEIASNPFGLPLNPTLFNYELVLGTHYKTIAISFDAPPLIPSFITTSIVASSTVILSIVLGLMAAYGVVRFKVGSRFLPFWFLSLLFAPPIIFAFPLYYLFHTLGLLDNVFGLILANLIFNLPFSTLIFISSLSGAPKDIEEAALIDGASWWTILWKVVAPIMRSVIVAVAALVFIFSWNEYLFSVILMTTTKVLTVALGSYNTGQVLLYTPLAAGIVVSIIPSIIVLIFFEKYLTQGLSFGAIKG